MSVMPPRDRVPSIPLDDVSKAIIEQLQQDGRRPYAAIGKAVGLSEEDFQKCLFKYQRDRRFGERIQQSQMRQMELTQQLITAKGK